MRRLFVWLFVLGLVVAPTRGQELPQRLQDLRPTPGLASNTVQELAAAGDSLWAGPLLTVYVEGDDQLFTPDGPVVQNRLIDGSNVVLSLATETQSAARSTVWAGLAFDAGGGAIGAGGFLVSTDGGQSFEARPVPLDDPADTTIAYGSSTLPAVPITQEAGSPPRDLALGRGGTVWVAGARSGLRRSVDQGQTWSRVVLPPDTSTRIEPSQSYDFLVAPPLDDGRGFQNYRALSVLVDETGTVWAGTVAGLNRSTPNGEAPNNGDRAWRLFRPDGTPNSLTGQIVFELAEQPRLDGRNPIWMATLRADTNGPLQRTGITMTPDGGETFRQPLIGEQVNDLAARQTRVYAAAESGLFVSGDQGETWRSIKDVVLRSEDQVLPGELTARSVEVTPSALWVGTTEGLLRLDRAQEPRLLPGTPEADPPRWQLFRTEVPVNPEDPTEQAPKVSTYAYPNPFVLSRDEVVRIAYDVPEPQTVEVTIYDFGMNRVRTLREQESAGQQEMVWDGTDASGLRLPTGTYLYTVEVGGASARGKILLTN